MPTYVYEYFSDGEESGMAMKLINAEVVGGELITNDGSKMASEEYVKGQTRMEHGRANHKGTKNTRVIFAKSFTRLPKVMCDVGKAINISVTGFTHQMDNAVTEDVPYVAFPANGGV